MVQRKTSFEILDLNRTPDLEKKINEIQGMTNFK